MEIIDLDDQIRVMASIIAAGLLARGDGTPDGLAREAVDIAAAISNEVESFEWKFGRDGRIRRKDNPCGN